MTKRKFITFPIGIIIIILLSSCGTEPPASHIWWSRADSLAVDSILSQWRDTINGYNVIRNQSYNLDISVPLVLSDTAPRTTYISQIKKIARFRGLKYSITERPLITQYTFGRKNDSIQTKDTFCYVAYRDSSNSIITLQFDSIWTINFYPDTLIIPPAETIITYRVLNYTKTYHSPLEQENSCIFQTRRYLELKKENNVLNYQYKYMSGFGSYLPDNASAPVISNFIITKTTGQRDTFRYSPRANRKGLLNLLDKDSLYSINVNEPVTLQISLTASTDQNFVFISQASPFVTTKQYLPITNNVATANISFNQIGLNHLFIEAIPASALFYPNAQWKTTIWALPVRIKP